MKPRLTRRRFVRRRAGLSLIELLAVVTILGVIAAIVIPRVSLSTDKSEQTVERHHIAHLNSLCEQFYLQTGDWPDALTDLAPIYLPDGVPTPLSGGAYTFNDTTNRVEVTP